LFFLSFEFIVTAQRPVSRSNMTDAGWLVCPDADKAVAKD
jgi:hypothetical protein